MRLGCWGAQHFAGVGQGGGGQLFAAQHAGNFTHPLLAIDRMHSAETALFVRLLRNHPMVVCTSGDLRSMGDRQHLTVTAELFHQTAHGFGNRAADTGVDFIEDQCLRGTQLAGGHGYGQGYAG